MTVSQTEMFEKLRKSIWHKRRTQLASENKKRDWYAIVISLGGQDFEMSYQGTAKDCRWYRRMFLEQLHKHLNEPTDRLAGKPTKGPAAKRNADSHRAS